MLLYLGADRDIDRSRMQGVHFMTVMAITLTPVCIASRSFWAGNGGTTPSAGMLLAAPVEGSAESTLCSRACSSDAYGPAALTRNVQDNAKKPLHLVLVCRISVLWRCQLLPQ